MPAEASSVSVSGQPSTKRRKISLACEACRNRKARCNGAKPRCGNCSQRLERCLYRLSNTQLAETNGYIDSLVSRVSELEGIILQMRDAASATSPMRPQSRNALQPTSVAQIPLSGNRGRQHENHEATRSIPADAQQNLSPPSMVRLVVDASSPVDGMGGNSGVGDPLNTGEKFYGSSSATSFMNQLCSMVSFEKDPTNTSRTDVSGSETTILQHQQNSASSFQFYGGHANFSLMPRVLTDYLVDVYWNKVYHLYPFLHRWTFMAAYEQLWAPASGHNISRRPALGLGGSEQSGSTSPAFHCALNAIMVLGVQFSDFAVEQRNNLTKTLVHRARSQFSLDMFDDGSIEIVQTLLLLVQIFQFTTFPTRCWSAMGAACRLAQGLGLHVPNDRSWSRLQPAEMELRNRLWHCCLMLDMVVSMTLGRPAVLQHNSELRLPKAIEYDDDPEAGVAQQPDQFPKISFFIEAVKLYKTLSHVLSQVYGENESYRLDAAGGYGSFDRLVELDNELAQFAEQVPEPLNWTKSATKAYDSPLLAQQRHVLHARYLHLRILLYRPTFTHFCRLHSPFKQSMSSTNDSIPASVGLSPATSFARCSSVTCVQSAIDLVALTYQHAATDATGAWWYNMFFTRTAAMVILLANVCPMVRESVGCSVLRSSWEHCRSILLHKLPQDTTVQTCLQTLERLHEHILKSARNNTGEVESASADKLEHTEAPNAANGVSADTELSHIDEYWGDLFDNSAFSFAMDDYGISLL